MIEGPTEGIGTLRWMLSFRRPLDAEEVKERVRAAVFIGDSFLVLRSCLAVLAQVPGGLFGRLSRVLRRLEAEGRHLEAVGLQGGQ